MSDDDQGMPYGGFTATNTFITGIPKRPSAAEVLEQALARVRAGQATAVAVCEVWADGSVIANWSQPGSYPLMISTATLLQHGLMAGASGSSVIHGQPEDKS